ncbi:lipopolysaccharide biosynthesis protein [Sinorhizobium medicae]|nr:lipopolysaccharide biosynthesis protein [Sinorhizobium medicae]
MTAKLPLSAFIICLNEAAYLGNCIESLEQCAEIVIVDSGSTDGTAALVQSYIDAGWPIRFMHEPWRGYAGQKQFALEQCSEPWCFNIDADERLDGALRNLLPELLATSDEIVGWRVARRPYLIGYGYTPENVRERRNLRLIRRGRGGYDLSQKVHEGIVPDGNVGKARTGSLLHFRPLVSGKRPRFYKLVFAPPIYFLRLYFRNGLWRCGLSGFIEAMTGAVYAFLTAAKIYQRHALEARPNVDDALSR